MGDRTTRCSKVYTGGIQGVGYQGLGDHMVFQGVTRGHKGLGIARCSNKSQVRPPPGWQQQNFSLLPSNFSLLTSITANTSNFYSNLGFYLTNDFVWSTIAMSNINSKTQIKNTNVNTREWGPPPLTVFLTFISRIDNSHSYTHLILALGIVREPTVGG